MARESSFYFVPLRKAKVGRIPKEKFVPTVAISKAGQMTFAKRVLEHFELGKSGAAAWIHLYGDPSRRALAFKIDRKQIVGSKSDNVKLLKVSSYQTDKSLQLTASISVISFLHQIPSPKLPTGPLEIKKYNDALIGDVHYVIIPKDSNKKVDPEQEDEDVRSVQDNAVQVHAGNN